MKNDRANLYLKTSQNTNWQGFVFLRDSVNLENDIRSLPESAEALSTPTIFPLSQAAVGDRVSLDCVLSNPLDRMLSRMGLFPGSVLQVISRLDSGSVIIVLDRQHIGLGAQMAQVILVQATQRI